MQELLFGTCALLIFVLAWHLFGFALTLILGGLVVLALSLRGKKHHARASGGTSEYGVQFRWLGRVILLLAAFFALGYLVPGHTTQEQIVFLTSRQPPYCDWAWAPFGDKHCHYESSFRHVYDSGGEHITIEWRRVGD